MAEDTVVKEKTIPVSGLIPDNDIYISGYWDEVSITKPVRTFSIPFYNNCLLYTSTSLLKEALEFIRGLTMVQKLPCQYTVEELKERLILAKRAVEERKRCV